MLTKLKAILDGSLLGGKPHAYFITDGMGWSFDWDCHYLSKYLHQTSGVEFKIVNRVEDCNPGKKKGKSAKIYHYGSRYALLKKQRHIHEAGSFVLLTWFHGVYGDPDMAELFDRLIERVDDIDVIVTSCESSRLELLKAGVPERRIEIIPIGVDLECFSPVDRDAKSSLRKKAGIPENAFCIGSFQKDGQGWEDSEDVAPKLIKGPDIFLKTVQAVQARVPEVFIVLSGPARGYVIRGLKELGVSYYHQNLEDYRDIAQLYQMSDVCLITSRCEGGPKSLAESWASGVPVVSTEMGMPADYIKHGENGMTAAVEDHLSLADHVLTLKSDASLNAEIVSQALVDVKSLDWQAVAEKYCDQVYRAIIA